jgi:peptidoglycan/xylan/chitin deacetylase (PgdA/CDA1 family)
MDTLHTWAGLSPAGRPGYRVLDRGEVVRLADSDLVAIGSHTVTHPMLSRMMTTEQIPELMDSKKQLEALLDKPVDTLSYPYGNREDVARITRKIAKSAGYQLACANIPGRVSHGSNPYMLPRFLVRDWGEDVFALKLQEWCHE